MARLSIWEIVDGNVGQLVGRVETRSVREPDGKTGICRFSPDSGRDPRSGR
jgi:hypothetical protein